MKRCLIGALCALFLLSGCAVFTAGNTEPAAPQPDPAENPPAETREEVLLEGEPDSFTLAWPEMQNADFWIARLENPQKVRMDEGEIARYNAMICETDGTDLEDLSAWPEALSAARLRELIGKYPESPNSGAYTDGGPITDAQRAEISANRNLSAVAESNPVRYGFLTREVLLRSYPSALPVYSGPDRAEYDLAAETAEKLWEPVLVLHASADGQWYLARAFDYLGWIPADGVALCARNTWDNLRNQLKTNFLTVLAPRLALSGSFENPGQENLILRMGTRLPLSGAAQADNASMENCYAVQLPGRKADGTLSLITARIPTQEEVTVGALPYTEENLLRTAFRLLGQRYGWGGTISGWDCSSFYQDVYRVMGLDLPRNSGSQAHLPGGGDFYLSYSPEEMTEFVAEAPVGCMLEMPGHQTLLVGSYQGVGYVLHATHGVYDSQGRFYNANSVILTSVEARRPNGGTLQENCQYIVYPDTPVGSLG